MLKCQYDSQIPLPEKSTTETHRGTPKTKTRHRLQRNTMGHPGPRTVGESLWGSVAPQKPRISPLQEPHPPPPKKHTKPAPKHCPNRCVPTLSRPLGTYDSYKDSMDKPNSTTDKLPNTRGTLCCRHMLSQHKAQNVVLFKVKLA